MMWRLFLLTALCLGTAIAVPALDSARASSIEISNQGQLRYLADKPEDGSEVNHVNIWLDGDLIYVQDTAGIETSFRTPAGTTAPQRGPSVGRRPSPQSKFRRAGRRLRGRFGDDLALRKRLRGR